MIVRLRGPLLQKIDSSAVVEVGGVGYEVAVAPFTAQRLPEEGSEVTFYVQESTALYGGAVTLYGFLAAEERTIFNLLREHVPGAGARKSLEMLDRWSAHPEAFHQAIAEKNPRDLTLKFGFSAKTAEKLVAGLHGRLPEMKTESSRSPRSKEGVDETLQALMALGYREPAARSAALEARRSLGEEAGAAALIRGALRTLSSGIER